MPTEYPPVEVEWIDSSDEEGWQEEDYVLSRIEEPWYMHARTVGYLIADKPDKIVLAHSVAPTGEHTNVLQHPVAIPRVAVTRMTSLVSGETLYEGDADTFTADESPVPNAA